MPDQIDTSPWAELAAQARALADLADELAARDPASLAPAGGVDILADLNTRAEAIQVAVASCKAATWRSLFNGGRSAADIGRMWNVSRQKVSDRLR